MLAASLPALALALAGTTQSPTSALAARARIAAVPCVHREPRARAAASMGLFGWRGAAEEDDQAGDARAPRRGRGGRGEAVDAPVARTTWAERGVNADSANPAKFEADEDDSYGGYVIERRAPPRATRAAAVAPSRRRARPAGSGRAGSYAEGLDGDGAYYGDVVRNVYAEPLVSLADFDESGRPLSPPVGAEYDADGYEIGSPGDPRMADFARNVRAEGDWRLNLYSSWLREEYADEYEDDQWTGDAAQQQQRVSELPDLDEEKDPVTGISPGFSSPTSRAPPLARPASAKLQGRPLPRRQPSAQAYGSAYILIPPHTHTRTPSHTHTHTRTPSHTHTHAPPPHQSANAISTAQLPARGAGERASLSSNGYFFVFQFEMIANGD
ncbi:hypothetical protein T492DRAFT_831809 [Pavlovales sp. CCMP2436]|nr:hypothetical protein T492DRAFT_831809 [Pavlovales sp. CCMP2436]